MFADPSGHSIVTWSGRSESQELLLQAALNGYFSKSRHPASPESVDELKRDSSACVAATAWAIQLHPRDSTGGERQNAGVVDSVVPEVSTAVSLGARHVESPHAIQRQTGIIHLK